MYVYNCSQLRELWFNDLCNSVGGSEITTCIAVGIV